MLMGGLILVERGPCQLVIVLLLKVRDNKVAFNLGGHHLAM